ncbi:MAG TPA: ferritin-like domain-containing protein [Myxococcota bacterium]|nr:ferritin-like domain-containing protein [Myxococcota bacterium]
MPTTVRRDSFLFYSLASISFLETTVPLYVDNLLPFFGDDPETQDWLREVWRAEESSHGRVTREYVARTWPEFDWPRSYERFVTVYGPRCAHELLRPSPALEALARCVTETETAMAYRCFADYTSDPELAAMLRAMSADEVRHYGYFRRLFVRYDARERNSTWRKARTLVARSQLVRDEDLRLAFESLDAGWSGSKPFARLTFEQYLERAREIMADHFPMDEAQRMLFRPLRSGRWFERRLVSVLGHVVRRQYSLAA